MKHCGHCNIDVDNSFNLCPYCGRAFTEAGSAPSPHTVAREEETASQHQSAASEHADQAPQGVTAHHTIPFQIAENGKFIFNGQVVESNAQQYYQSKLTKVIRAVFHGEPYQFSHTTFVTVFRVEEHMQRGFAEQARDIVVYGQLQNVLATGDDVTVVAQQEGNRLVAKSIINHSSEAQIMPQRGTISAQLVRVFVFIPLIILVVLLFALISTPSNVVIGTLLNIFWPAILIGVGITWLKSKFKKK